MGGAVSSGRNNNELIDNLMGGNYIRSRDVERVFRALDRAEYMTPESRDQAYKDLAWRNGPLHISAPCIYSEVMEGLELKPGLSFLNVGSGTGYLSTLVGLIIGSSGISHGVEVHPSVVEYSVTKLGQFIENSPILDDFDFCEPRYYCGNGLSMAPLQTPYDRVYCGAGCPEEYQNYFKQLIKVGGVLVMPLDDKLVQVRRVAADEWRSRTLLSVSFAQLRTPAERDAAEPLRLDEQSPVRLQVLARAVIRSCMRTGLMRRHPELREPEPRAPPPAARKPCPRRICIPVEDDSDPEGLNALHDLDRASGANEMNALLSLVLSMGHNRVAGALRVDQLRSDSSDGSDSSDSGDDHDDGDDQDPRDDRPAPRNNRPYLRNDRREPRSDRPEPHNDRPTPRNDRPGSRNDRPESNELPRRDRGSESEPVASRTARTARTAHSVIMFELRDRGEPRPAPDPALDAPAERDARGTQHTHTPSLPSEVEIYLGKSSSLPGTSVEGMQWTRTSSDEDAGSSRGGRIKLDSGLGEENTPSTTSERDRDDTDDSDHDSTRSGEDKPEHTDDTAGDASPAASVDACAGAGCARRRWKRAHGELARSASCSSTESEGGAPSRSKRRAGGGQDARRVRLSVVMKRGVKELPLPHALKKFVNLGRCYQF